MASKRWGGYCFVPGCRSTRKSVPEKLFFHVPQGEMRKKWCEVARRDPSSIALTSRHKFCCQDHFTLEEDMQDWIRYKIMKDAGMKTYKLKLKPHVVPHIFDCQPDRKNTHTKRLRPAVAKRQRAEIIKNLLQEIKDAEPTFYLQREAEHPESPNNQLEYYEEKEESSDVVEEHVDFDYQDSLWAPYCDVSLQEDSSTSNADLETYEICSVSQEELAEGSVASLSDGTHFVLEIAMSAEPTGLRAKEGNMGSKADEKDETAEQKIEDTHAKRADVNDDPSQTKARNLLKSGKKG